jgi:hypothetical protein
MAVNWTSMTKFGDLPLLANQATDGMFWLGMNMMIFVVLFLLFIGFGFEVALLISAFIALISAILLVYAGLMAWHYALIYLGIILIMFLYIIWNSGRRKN